jgi:hypothetical protein
MVPGALWHTSTAGLLFLPRAMPEKLLSNADQVVQRAGRGMDSLRLLFHLEEILKYSNIAILYK